MRYPTITVDLRRQNPGDVFLFSGVPGTWMREATKAEIKEYQDARS